MKEDVFLKSSYYNTPIYIILGFNIFTILLFVTAPFEWDYSMILLTVLYIIFNLSSIYVGYKIGVKIGIRSFARKALIFNSLNKLTIIFFFSFYTLTFLVKYAYLTRYSIFDISGMITYLSFGFIQPEWAYNQSVYDDRPHTVSWSIFIFISIINQIFFIFGFLSWKKLKLLYKIVLVIYIGIEIFYWLGRATGFGVISMITTFFISYLITKKNLNFSFKSVIVSLVLLTFSILFYGNMKAGRAGNRELDLSSFNFVNAPVNPDHFIFSIIPEGFTQTYMHTVAYLTQGYYHMSMAFEAPFNSTFFLGNNPAIVNIARVSGVDIWERTYIHWLYVNKGVNEFSKWHSAYVWFANDVSFIGVPVIVFLISVIVGSSFVLSRTKNDLLSMLVFVMSTSMLVYLFANNTYLYNVFYSCVLLVPIWILTRIVKIIF